MPTYRISNRLTGAVLAPSVQSDSDVAAAAEYLDSLGPSTTLTLEDFIVTQISANPPAAIFTVAVNLSEGQGGGVREITTTGSRATAAREASKHPGAFVIEEDREQNRERSKGRRG
jgi:hypothetical protein